MGVFTARKRSLGQGSIFTKRVTPSVHRGGSAPGGGLHGGGPHVGDLHVGGLHVRESLHPGGLHPGGGGQTPQQILGDTVNEQVVCILLECILVLLIFL